MSIEKFYIECKEQRLSENKTFLWKVQEICLGWYFFWFFHAWVGKCPRLLHRL